MSIKEALKKFPYFHAIWRLLKAAVNWILQIRGYWVAAELKKGILNKKATYHDLYRIQNKTKYLKYLRISQKLATDLIVKASKNRKIKIAFQVSFIATWIGDDIVALFEKNDRFDVTIVIVWQNNSDKYKETTDLKKHFKKTSSKTVVADGRIRPSDFDIIVFTSPYLEALNLFNRKMIPLKVLPVYIPYGIYAAGIQDVQFNGFIQNIVWKNFATVKYHMKQADKYCGIGRWGMVYAGYPKLDVLFRKAKPGDSIWKVNCLNEKVKKIIYAPHHSIKTVPYYSTFDKNKDFFLNYAKEHQDTTAWIFKPHPLLRDTAVSSGVFQSKSDYDEYVEQWNRLPNAKTVEGEYLDFFMTSDALVLDSVSFMTEYIYVNKPILFLTRDGQEMNEFGRKVFDVLYKAKGDDYDEIERFLKKTIYSDEMKEIRENFYKEYLDYYTENGMTASEYIYTDVIRSLLFQPIR